ncbi:kama family protein [Xylariaceae sp. FL0016]|nr:kama family protein [Xylariaceae sp. FL0016]
MALRRSVSTFRVPTTPHAYWKRIPVWSSVSEDEFISYEWQTKNSVHSANQLFKFMKPLLPDSFPRENALSPTTAEELVGDVVSGIKLAPMATRITPHVLSLINWSDPLHDPLLRQFIPLKSRRCPDHPKVTLDSLSETDDSPVKGQVPDTDSLSKTRFLPIMKKWETMFNYIKNTPSLVDILISGGDSYTLTPDQMRMIGMRLLEMPHIERIRIASKGVAICPSRLIDPRDEWTKVLIELSHRGRKMGKSVALHTHFNHPHEITWITQKAARRLFEEGVTVRNQTVLLRHVNNDVDTMRSLIKQLAAMNVQPYYVFQCDMVRGVEDMRTPLHEILTLESMIRGSTAGFMTPNFVVNLPGGGMKRLACSYESYDRTTGRSTFLSPGSKDGTRQWEYWDPLYSLPQPGELQ